MARPPARPVPTAVQAADAERLHAALLEASAGDLRQSAEPLAATDETPFGATEFVGRDSALGIGAEAVRAAAAGRGRNATAGAAVGARPATDRPSSSGGGAAPS